MAVFGSVSALCSHFNRDTHITHFNGKTHHGHTLAPRHTNHTNMLNIYITYKFTFVHMFQFSLILYCLIYSALLFSVSCPSSPPSPLRSALLTDSLPSGRLSDKWGQMESCHCCCWPRVSSLRLLLSSALKVLFISTITRLVFSV